MNSIYKSVILILASLISNVVFAQKGVFTESKHIRKAAQVNLDTRVNIQNKHGSVYIKSWDKDSIRIYAEITGSSKNLEKLQDLMNRTTILVHTTKAYTDITTVIDQGLLSQEWRNIKNLAGYEEEINIDYKVYIPKGCELKLENTFGNIYLNDHQGKLDLRLDHGDLRAGNLPNLKFFSGEFVNAYIKSCGDANLVLNFSELDLRQGGNIKIQSKSSTLEIDMVVSLQMSSTRDKLRIESINSLDIDAGLSKIKIEQINESATVALRYGRITFEQVHASCTALTFKPTHSTIDLNMTEGCSFIIEGFGEELEVYVADDLGKASSQNMKITGQIGNSANSKGRVFIQGSKSTINILKK